MGRKIRADRTEIRVHVGSLFNACFASYAHALEESFQLERGLIDLVVVRLGKNLPVDSEHERTLVVHILDFEEKHGMFVGQQLGCCVVSLESLVALKPHSMG
jgi:hypothetical protein